MDCQIRRSLNMVSSGHHLGMSYGPKKLRALRRFTIHRTFALLDKGPSISTGVHRFWKAICGQSSVSIVTTNWDILAELCLEDQNNPFNYGGDTYDVRGNVVPLQGVPVLKLHGSANWGYCDCCRNLITFPLDLGKAALNLQLLLNADDFRLFQGGDPIAERLDASDGLPAAHAVGDGASGWRRLAIRRT